MSNKHHWVHQRLTMFITVSLTSQTTFAFKPQWHWIFQSIVHFTGRLMLFAFCPYKPPVRNQLECIQLHLMQSSSEALNYCETIQDTHCPHPCLTKCYGYSCCQATLPVLSNAACTAGRNFRSPWGSTLWGAPRFSRSLK